MYREKIDALLRTLHGPRVNALANAAAVPKIEAQNLSVSRNGGRSYGTTLKYLPAPVANPVT